MDVEISIGTVHPHLIFIRINHHVKNKSSDIAAGTISGFGVTSYELALIAANRLLSKGQS